MFSSSLSRTETCTWQQSKKHMHSHAPPFSFLLLSDLLPHPLWMHIHTQNCHAFLLTLGWNINSSNQTRKPIIFLYDKIASKTFTNSCCTDGEFIHSHLLNLCQTEGQTTLSETLNYNKVVCWLKMSSQGPSSCPHWFIPSVIKCTAALVILTPRWLIYAAWNTWTFKMYFFSSGITWSSAIYWLGMSNWGPLKSWHAGIQLAYLWRKV